MATTYFEVINDNNRVLIDDKQSRLCLKRHGWVPDLCTQETGISFGMGSSYVKAPQNIAYYGVIFTITLADDEDFVSFYLLEGFSEHCIVYTSQYGKTVRFYFVGNTTNTAEMNNAVNYTYMYVYGQRDIKNETYGLEIFDENGKQIYHSSDKLLNIKGVGSYDLNVNNYYDRAYQPLTDVDGEYCLSMFFAPRMFYFDLSGKTFNIPFTTIRGITKKGNEYGVQNISVYYAEGTYRLFNLLSSSTHAITYTISDASNYHMD